MKTLQQHFNYIARKLMDQGKKSVDREGDCVYHGSRGACCAVGFMLKGKYYDKTLEGTPADHLPPYLFKKGGPLAIQGVNNAERSQRIWYEIQQSLHDGLRTLKPGKHYFRRELVEAAERFATSWNLDLPPACRGFKK